MEIDRRKNKLKILLIDDDPEVLSLLQVQLASKAKFRVETADCGRMGLDKARTFLPDIILLDVKLSDLNGYDVCRALRKIFETSLIPIIMLTAQSDYTSLKRGVAAGIDDYITKPYQIDALITRIHMVLLRNLHSIHINPTTQLPGNTIIQKTLTTRLDKDLKFAFCYVDIDNFKYYNDRYSYAKGDRILKELGLALVHIIRGFGNEEDFIGHIGGDDFVVITTLDKYQFVCQKIIAQFEAFIPRFYSQEDLNLGYIECLNRKNELERFPIMTISIGVVTNEKVNFANHHMISDYATQMKGFAKSFPGSNYKVNQRFVV